MCMAASPPAVKAPPPPTPQRETDINARRIMRQQAAYGEQGGYAGSLAGGGTSGRVASPKLGGGTGVGNT